MDHVREFVQRVTGNVGRVIVGNEDAVELLLVALLTEGHVLLEDVPGVGKTMLARSLAITLGGKFKRLQCTPDLLPNDITGVSVYNQQTGAFEFRPGPVFVNILLADEINRATPRTQSALLEAMQEQQVSVDGVSRPLPRPFLVLATQNPIEYEGTFPLPEAQLDRFLMRITLGYPEIEDERKIIRALKREHPVTHLEPVASTDELLHFHPQVWDVFIDETLEDYILNLVTATRRHPDLAVGASPRASVALYKAAQALAAVRGRDHVIPEDIKHLSIPVLAHRLLMRPEAELRGKSSRMVLTEVIEATPLKLESEA
ncbi:MAG TPA: MoxR family ATPase [Anaerolineaceae bacterium]|nr:MoxR family ATPase [Anaerolineaceae bacterium]